MQIQKIEKQLNELLWVSSEPQYYHSMEVNFDVPREQTLYTFTISQVAKLFAELTQ